MKATIIYGTVIAIMLLSGFALGRYDARREVREAGESVQKAELFVAEARKACFFGWHREATK